MEISASEPDWSREMKQPGEWAPGKSLLASVRLYQRCAGKRDPWHWGLSKVAVLKHRFWSVVSGADIPLNCHIAGGLLIPHPNGVVVHPRVEIGPNCLLLQQSTVAGDSKLGGHVDVGAGAKILGVALGDHSRVGANAVVTHDVPAGVTVVGIPARAI